VPLLRSLLSVLAPPLCFACRSHASREPLCGRCRAELPWLGSAPFSCGPVPGWAPLAYEGPARALVRGLKFGGAAGLAEVMAAHVVANAPRGLLEAGALVPVPLHPARRRRRGYNQAELLAAAVGKRCGLPVADCLERTGSRATQVGRRRAERLVAIAGGIVPKPDVAVPRTAILMDDVITTGATISACAEALSRAGADDVLAVAYARTQGR
jgi:ComF family protein